MFGRDFLSAKKKEQTGSHTFCEKFQKLKVILLEQELKARTCKLFHVFKVQKASWVHAKA